MLFLAMEGLAEAPALMDQTLVEAVLVEDMFPHVELVEFPHACKSRRCQRAVRSAVSGRGPIDIPRNIE